MSYPNIILITDSYPCSNGAGISQTLYNLFLAYPGKITVICEKEEVISDKASILPSHKLMYKAFWLKPVTNRLGRYINPFFASINHEWLTHAPIPEDILLLRATSRVVLSTNVVHKLVFGWKLLKAGFTVVPYFMDDWINGNNTRWRSSSVQQLATSILRKAPARLMISVNLKQTLEERYQLPVVPTLVVHNPSPPVLQIPPSDDKFGQSSMLVPTSGCASKDTRTIVYAGSIWPMHADALCAVAKAVHLLHKGGKNDFRLCIYAPKPHWEKYYSSLQSEAVYWGGWLLYNEVRYKLLNAWLLLCTASFDESYEAYTKSSVQTKLTDYIAAGKPVLVVAPTGAASGEWVQRENCGYWIKTNEPELLASHLQNLAHQNNDWEEKAQHALELAETKYSSHQVQQMLYTFINEYTSFDF